MEDTEGDSVFPCSRGGSNDSQGYDGRHVDERTEIGEVSFRGLLRFSCSELVERLKGRITEAQKCRKEQKRR